MKLYEIILPQNLYHYTHYSQLFDICQQDQLGSSTSDVVSFTRMPLQHPFRGLAEACLVLDLEKIKHRYKLEKFIGDFPAAFDDNDFDDQDEDKGYPREAEEYTRKPIFPLHQYLQTVIVLDDKNLQFRNKDILIETNKILTGYCSNYRINLIKTPDMYTGISSETKNHLLQI